VKSYSRVLSIAGSDSGGGAGIQADLKTFAACGCFGMSVVTAITAQNTCGVDDIHTIPTASIAAQIRAVLDDIGADAVKIGMLHSAEVINTVADNLRSSSCGSIVVDPVMVATSGDRLIEESAVVTLKRELLPLATLITPNIAEAEIMTGKNIRTQADMETAAVHLRNEFGINVLLKGGHLEDDALVDIMLATGAKRPLFFPNRRIDTRNTHGTGCTLSSAITAFMAQGKTLAEAVDAGEKYLHAAIAAGAGYSIGKGHGPVHHFHRFW